MSSRSGFPDHLTADAWDMDLEGYWKSQDEPQDAAKQVQFIHGRSHKPFAVAALKLLIRKSETLTGTLIIGYPVGVDAVLVSEEGQVTVIDLNEGADTTGHRDRQDRAFNQVDRLLSMKDSFREGRRPKIRVQSVTMATGRVQPDESEPEYPLANTTTIGGLLEKFQQTPPNGVDGEEVLNQVMWLPPAL